ncbi:hypothetical protein [Frankia sp. CiP3]|uniref:hypothetical protein n=1 Tax=Frankia sp. CiP3 TaxID=2880971 RepID=UPI001EF731F9|nr:hypothetical protein [Frankia sp. CiP3]
MKMLRYQPPYGPDAGTADVRATTALAAPARAAAAGSTAGGSTAAARQRLPQPRPFEAKSFRVYFAIHA